MYGQKKLIAKRVPVVVAQRNSATSDDNDVISKPGIHDLPVPAMTDGETGTDTELETETEMEGPATGRLQRRSRHRSRPSTDSSGSSVGRESPGRHRHKAISQHDLLNKYFRRDAVILKNVDLLRFVMLFVH